jgi:hypothetical protein
MRGQVIIVGLFLAIILAVMVFAVVVGIVYW